MQNKTPRHRVRKFELAERAVSRIISYARIRPLTWSDAARLYRSYLASAATVLRTRGEFGGVGSKLGGNTPLRVRSAGLRFSIRPRSEDLTYILADHKPTVTHWFRPRPGQIVVDVGSHIGFFSIAAAAKGASVVSIEPNPGAIDGLRKSASMNGLRNLEFHQVAIGDRPRTGILEVPLIWDGKASLVSGWATGRRPGASFDKIEVQVETLDGVLQNYAEQRIDWLLIDAEGSELEVLSGAARTLARTAHILVEVSFASIDEIARNLVVRHGFRIDSVEHQTLFTSYIVASKAIGPYGRHP